MPSPSKSRFRQTALASGLVTQEDLDQAEAALRVVGQAVDPESDEGDQRLAEQLVEQGSLNRWQADQLLSGRTKWNLGPYRILDQIGHGGMGQVFKAEHTIMRRIVAIKVLPLHKSTPDSIERFRREIQAQAQLDHPNLVRAYDAGQDGSVHFLVTEYVPGMDLRKLIKNAGPLDMPAAAAVLCQAAQGLEHAHSRGLIHRDVKPGNLLVNPEGVCKVSDLGLAGFLHQNEDEERKNKTVGTADYLSPEQIMTPDRLTPATDVYALGCTLYYAVTGKVPFPGGTSKEKAKRHCHEQPVDPRRINTSLDPAYVDVIADMMIKEPDERIKTAAEVIPRLRPWAGDDWPATVLSGGPQFGDDSDRGKAMPPPLPVDFRPLQIPDSEHRDGAGQFSQGTLAWGSPSDDTMALDSQSQASFSRPPEDRLPPAVVIAIWLAIAAAMTVVVMIVWRSIF